MGLFTINKQFFILKSHFFFFQAGIAPTQTAMPVYAQTLGFSSFIVGTVYTILPLVALFLKPGLGALADRFKWHKSVMLVVEFTMMLCYFCVQFIPSGFTPPIQNSTAIIPTPEIFCHGNLSYSICANGAINESNLIMINDHNSIYEDFTMKCPLESEQWKDLCFQMEKYENCDKNIMKRENLVQNVFSTDQEHCFQFEVPAKEGNSLCLSLTKTYGKCKISRLGASTKDENNDDDEEEKLQDDAITFSQYQFYVFLVLLVGSFSGTAIVTTLSDTICIAKTGPYLYGKQRLWGSLGYGVLSVVSGLIVDAISEEGQPKDYTPAFYLCLAVMSFDIITSYFYINVEIPQESQSIGKDVYKVFSNVKVIVFCIWCAAMGISMGLTWTFLYWLLEDLAKSTGPDVVSNIKTIEGLTNGVQTFLGETPAFFFAGWVLTKIGHGHSMTVILLTIGLRFTIYSFLSNPWYVLFVEPLQLYYGLFYSTMTSYANLVAVPGTQATVQSLMCAMCEGVGVAIGSFVGGLLYDSYGGLTTFRIFGIAFFIMAVANECIELLYRYMPNNERMVDQEQTSPSN